MNILINDEKLEFKLEREESLGDIIRGLEHWILKNGNVIESIAVDNRKVPLDYGSLEFNRGVEAIREIKIITSNKIDLAINTIVTVGEYIHKFFDEFIGSETIKQYEAILDGLRLIYNGTTDALKVLKINPIMIIDDTANPLNKILGDMNDFIAVCEKQYLDKEGIARLKSLLDRFLGIIPKIFKWTVLKNYEFFKELGTTQTATFFSSILQDMYLICSQSSEKFEMISRNLQIGEDRQALTDLTYMTELLDEIISVLIAVKNIFDMNFNKLLLPKGSIDDLFGELTGYLKEVEDAFKNGDMITVGDLMEYEIRPLFEDVCHIVSRLSGQSRD
jgi:hypothetical protein